MQPNRQLLGSVLVIDILIVFFESWILSRFWRRHGKGTLRFYTQDSNYLALGVSIACGITELICMLAELPLPQWTKALRLVGASCLMLTFLVASCVLVPMDKRHTFYTFMLKGNLLIVHTVCPIMMLIAMLIHPGIALGLNHVLIAIIPTVLYGVVVVILNLLGKLDGPYPFLNIRRQPFYQTLCWLVLIMGINFGVAWVLTRISLL